MNALLLLILAATPPPPGYAEKVRPILLAAGCANGSCHGSTLAPLKLLDRPVSQTEAAAEAVEAWSLVDVKSAKESTLLQKAFGAREHIGGKNLEPGSCEVEHIVAWIEGKDPSCALTLRERSLPRPMQGPLPVETDRLMASCATSSCHGGPAAPRLVNGPEARAQNAGPLTAFGNGFAPTTSRLFGALTGKNKHPVLLKDPTSLEGRALFAWMSGETLAAPKKLPSLPVFRTSVLPLFVRRGCAQSTCHGGVGSGLLAPTGDETATDTYLRLMPRLANGTLWPKVTNSVAHGGGLVLGAKDDCVASQVQAWLDGKPLKTCKPRPPPSEATFAEVVQPAFETLKCTSCHKRGVGGMTLTDANGDASVVKANYAAVQQFIDLDFPPVSHVLLRVREPCLQSRILAWIAGKGQPTCTIAAK